MLFEQTNIGGAVEQVAWLATLHLTALDTILLQDMVQHWLFDIDLTFLRLLPEDRGVRVGRRRLDTCTITHATQKRLVSQVFLIEVRREHDELLERNFNLLARVQREIVNAPLQRDDPRSEEHTSELQS